MKTKRETIVKNREEIVEILKNLENHENATNRKNMFLHNFKRSYPPNNPCRGGPRDPYRRWQKNYLETMMRLIGKMAHHLD